jgi:hypothetical protein
MVLESGKWSEFMVDQGEPRESDEFPLTPDHRMLLQVRDTLYEGSWEDFLHDLRAKYDNRPHVYDITPPSPDMKNTIATHIGMIEAMRDWEFQHGCTLKAEDAGREPAGGGGG